MRNDPSLTEGIYTLSQLAALSHVSPRRIRYYISLDAVPPPTGRTRGARYNNVHLEAIERVDALMGKGLSVKEIGRTWPSPRAEQSAIQSKREKGHQPRVELGRVAQFCDWLSDRVCILSPHEPTSEERRLVRMLHRAVKEFEERKKVKRQRKQ